MEGCGVHATRAEVPVERILHRPSVGGRDVEANSNVACGRGTVDRPVPDCRVSLYSLVSQSQPKRRPKQDISHVAVSSECIADHPKGYNGEGDDREDSHRPHWNCFWRRLSLAKKWGFWGGFVSTLPLPNLLYPKSWHSRHGVRSLRRHSRLESAAPGSRHQQGKE